MSETTYEYQKTVSGQAYQVYVKRSKTERWDKGTLIKREFNSQQMDTFGNVTQEYVT
ncbi:hypothetical protein V9N52_004428, partial [Vibrio navarrensis]